MKRNGGGGIKGNTFKYFSFQQLNTLCITHCLVNVLLIGSKTDIYMSVICKLNSNLNDQKLREIKMCNS